MTDKPAPSIIVENDGGTLYASFPEGRLSTGYFLEEYVPISNLEGPTYKDGWDDAMKYIRKKTYE